MRSMRRAGAAFALVAAIVLSPLAGAGIATAAEAHPYEASGTSVSGGDSPDAAAEVEAGTYVDALEHGNTSKAPGGMMKYYRVNVGEGERLQASALFIPPADGSGANSTDENVTIDLSMVAMTKDGSSCVIEGPNDTEVSSPVLANPGALSVHTGPVGPEDPCPAGDIYVGVGREGTFIADTPVQFELVVRVEEAGGEDDSDPYTEQTPARTFLGDDPGELTEPGRSVGSAPTVASDQTVAIELAPGDRAYLGVDVAEDQTVAIRMEVPEYTGYADQLPSLSFYLLNPLRENVWFGEDQMGVRGRVDPALAAGTVAPVRLANRNSESDDVASAWLAGRHTLDIRYGASNSEGTDFDTSPLRVLVRIEAADHPEQAGDSEPSPERTELSTSEPSPVANPSPEADGAAAEDGSWMAGRIALALGSAAAALVAIASGTGAVVLARRRR